MFQGIYRNWLYFLEEKPSKQLRSRFNNCKTTAIVNSDSNLSNDLNQLIDFPFGYARHT
jgi:hypothetical protein